MGIVCELKHNLADSIFYFARAVFVMSQQESVNDDEGAVWIFDDYKNSLRRYVGCTKFLHVLLSSDISIL
jgi:hypothetical protein